MTQVKNDEIKDTRSDINHLIFRVEKMLARTERTDCRRELRNIKKAAMFVRGKLDELENRISEGNQVRGVCGVKR